MARYMMVYRGEATDLSDMTEEQGAAVLQKWGEWMSRLGGALVDIGSPFGPGGARVDDGSTAAASSLSGYSIVEASDLNEAIGLADGHPFLSEGKGNYAIDVFELMPVPFDA